MSLNVITIDGPAGSGKSTIAKLLASKLGWLYVTTGSIYRTFALLLNEANSKSSDTNPLHIERCLTFINEHYRQEPISGKIFLGNRNVTDEINSPEISQLASIYAQDEHIRKRLLPIQRKIVTESAGVVVEGRDMGTVVFPDAVLKIFLTASSEERAKRRYQEFLQKDDKITFEDVLEQINERDMRDKNRAIAPLKPASDAFIIDSSGKTLENILKSILTLALQKNITVSNL